MKTRVVSLFVDFFDSYSYNIIHYLRKVNKAEPIIVHPGEVSFEEFMKRYYDKVDNVVLSPAYGNPETNGNPGDFIVDLLKRKIDIPILGICYGHQLICYIYGCKIKKVKNMFHGDTNIINICKYGNIVSDLFKNINDGFKATCYNSLKVSKKISNAFLITCYSICVNEYIVMGIQHKHLPYYTVQYHPESIESEFSTTFFENFKNITLKSHKYGGKPVNVNYRECDLWNQYIQVEIKGAQSRNEHSKKKWKIKVVKISGVPNLCKCAQDIFKTVSYNEKDVSFWLDSNNEVLYTSVQGDSKWGQNSGSSTASFATASPATASPASTSGHDHEADENRDERNDALNNSRFSYMGNSKGQLSEMIEYYYSEDEGTDHINGTIVHLRKAQNDKLYKISYFSEDANNCLVYHLQDRINDFKNNYNIHLEEIKIENIFLHEEKNLTERDVIFSNKKANNAHSNSRMIERGINMVKYNSGVGEVAHRGADPSYERYVSKGIVEDDEFIMHKDSCLLGYFGFFTYEYKYETMKNLYNNKWKKYIKCDEKNTTPICVFIFPQNFITFDFVKKCIYLISLEPEKTIPNPTIGNFSSRTNSSCMHCPFDSDRSSPDVEDILLYNAKWNYETIHTIVQIVKMSSYCSRDNQISPTYGEIEKPILPLEHLSKIDKCNKNKIIFTPVVRKLEYIENVKKCKEYIEKGSSYELCLTTNFRGHYFISDSDSTPLDLLNMYMYVRNINKVSYSCFIHYHRKINIQSISTVSMLTSIDEDLKFTIMCFSPEEFLRKNKDEILFSKPIKGTIKRGKTKEEDIQFKEHLLNNKKERAENLMIVDLTTNDFNRMCQMDTVQVKKLFHIETYTYLHQMVSQICGKIKPHKTFAHAILNIFPGGSMTGAPKPISISILQDIEKIPRGVYSGSIGFISVQGNFILNIVIRTAIIKNSTIFVGAGGAVTIKSDETEEYEEMLLKFMSVARPICSYLLEHHNVQVEYKY
ncbi:para-aminobenzoic acid synthetase [Plasmodium gonderi]|uniref:aminodeoxychorismate synthase n=1 Tax=Plasmodium gonderi TaxID=77519 RepID=A0A1Y1JGF9_PLAGO|nr:para-aminobenzoic acid synthetase [Plasmodium gonderi]GAW80287.1 para-aminobenzoic acid synthetase [Plasmodium gonderi]